MFGSQFGYVTKPFGQKFFGYQSQFLKSRPFHYSWKCLHTMPQLSSQTILDFCYSIFLFAKYSPFGGKSMQFTFVLHFVHHIWRECLTRLSAICQRVHQFDCKEATSNQYVDFSSFDSSLLQPNKGQ